MLGEGLCTRLPLMQARAETAAVRAWTFARPIATWRQRGTWPPLLSQVSGLVVLVNHGRRGRLISSIVRRRSTELQALRPGLAPMMMGFPPQVVCG